MRKVNKKITPTHTAPHKQRSQVSAKRTSNFELYRIILMLLIIAHHYVQMSGLIICVSEDGLLSLKNFFYYIFGAWGKTGINGFVLITGYFMCEKTISSKKFAKLVVEVLFYNIVIYAIFVISGYRQLDWNEVFRILLPINNVGRDFVSCFLLFYLFIPFLQILIKNMKEKQHARLILLGIFVYTVLGYLPKVTHVTRNYLSWFVVLFLIASFVRLYPRPLFDSKRFWGLASVISIIIGCLSIIVNSYLSGIVGMDVVYWFVCDVDAPLALVIGFCSFMYFKNLNMSYHRWINVLGATTFGVFLIHTANCGEYMWCWLWYDTLHCISHYSNDLYWLYAICSVFIVFSVCSLIDYIRLQCFEKPLFKHFPNY